jgi:Amt family ammonium transporter
MIKARTATLIGLASVASLTALAFAFPALAQDATTAAPAAAAAAPAAAAAAPAAAAAAPVSPLNSGDTAWMLTSVALVLMMTIPGLGLFYAGMVRKKNVLATLMQSFAITCLVTVLWYIIGYSIAFTNDDPTNPGKFIGSFSHFMLNGIGVNSVNSLAPTIPDYVFSAFQMTFAIITPALICGAFAERMKF